MNYVADEGLFTDVKPLDKEGKKLKHRIKLSDYEKVWGTINVRNTNFYIIVHNVKKDIYSLHKDSINGYIKICSAKDPTLLLKHCT